MIDHDRLFKELLTTFFVEFLELFFPALAASLERESLVFLDKEFFTDVTVGERHEADLVVRARSAGEAAWFLLHVEHQAQAQPDFGRRMHRYFARLHEKHGVAVYPIVLFSYSRPRRAEPEEYVVGFPDLEVLRFRYRTVQLNRLDWRAYLEQPNPVASALMSRMHISSVDRPKVKAECLRLLASLRLDRARMQLISGFVDTYLRLTAEENSLFRAEIDNIVEREHREAAMKIVTSWMEEGREAGLHEGREAGLHEGREAALRQGLRLVLEARFGPAAASLEPRLDQVPAAELASLGQKLVQATWDEASALLPPLQK